MIIANAAFASENLRFSLMDLQWDQLPHHRFRLRRPTSPRSTSKWSPKSARPGSRWLRAKRLYPLADEAENPPSGGPFPEVPRWHKIHRATHSTCCSHSSGSSARYGRNSPSKIAGLDASTLVTRFVPVEALGVPWLSGS
jgi:hypothetical protein